MGYLFIERQGPKQTEVARVTSDGQWSGDQIVIRHVQQELTRRGLDPTSAEDRKQLPRIFGGSYFWAAEDNTA